MIRALTVFVFVAGYPAFVPSLLESSYPHCRSRFEVLATMFWVFLLLAIWVVALFGLLSLVTWRPE